MPFQESEIFNAKLATQTSKNIFFFNLVHIMNRFAKKSFHTVSRLAKLSLLCKLFKR